ncbi:phosphatidylethanolamine-binding protein [Lentinula aff. detonsa]|uniref:Phosphatidylethanolamine-binding protein n=1 Tax=Lentinula aff. detonsa TaxID=2804958 RepID=A0AA38NLA7_9AGAR|nr:phosphatidylethanolamine-binding protein [Lentinula aff. detonsa]KAJ3801413.1 phosphatidylethanolamine-binding protein [Lentinula aff. detonsa]
MIVLPLIFALPILFVSAQSNDTAVQIEAIEAHFTQAALVPELLATFDPSSILTINFDGVGDLSPGQSLTQDQVAPTPTIKVTAANSSVDLTGNFTLAMVDADVVGADESNITRHWLENSVIISDGQVSNSSATDITSYAGPAPASGSGPHRYVVILYQQPASFSPPSDFSQPNLGVSKFDLNGYVKDSQLGAVVAANYFTVEVGTSTTSISATSAVESSTLASISVTTTSGSAAASSTGSASNAASIPNAASSTLFLGMAALAVVAASL